MFVFSSQRKADAYKKRHTEAKQNVAEFLANPINAFLLIKRLTVEWEEIEELMFENTKNDGQ
jgi:prolyl 4-hydroxylase